MRWWVLGIVGLFAGAAATVRLGGWLEAPKQGPPPAGVGVPAPTAFASPYLNTGAEARYVGSAGCRGCHERADASYRTTGMGRSMADIDPAREPPDATFDHPLSQRRYQVHRKDGRVWHRELLLAGQPDEVVLSDHPLKYVVGSGRHSRTYLAEVDGFLVESPLTWYTSRNQWGMSPGYDQPVHLGFERPADEGCLLCHAGRAEAVGGSWHRMRVHEAAIGCERCHGPGSLHVARHAGAAKPPSGIDDTIVNPAHLPRELAEAVCQQCHLRGRATVAARGKKPADFRPGLPLQEFRHDYLLEVPDQPMTVVGHVEQLHRSRCYQASGTLTCLTCHDPHGEPPPQQRAKYYNAVCLDCHKPDRCTVAAERRQRESPANDCVHCHMPRSPTQIPHLAFTHHRIGVHGPAPAGPVVAGPAGAGELRPMLALAGLSDGDRQRSLGLAYLEVANLEPNAALAATYRARALTSLSAARESGLRGPLLDVSLARVCFDMNRGGVRQYAESALAQTGLAAPDECTALLLLADAHANEGRPAEAIALVQRLSQLRRHSGDWLLLADCERMRGDQRAAMEALETAVRLNPRLGSVHRSLAQYYRGLGDRQRAAWHERRAVDGHGPGKRP